MSLSKKVVLTVSGYKISLSYSLQFYQNDHLKLIFEINKYGIDVGNSFTHKTLMPLQPLTATLFIETPLGVDSIESANIEDNAVTFYLTSNQTQHIGTSTMQIKLTDDDGCQITLPSFTFEVQENIYNNAVHVSGILLADEDGNVLSDENGNTINSSTTTETTKQIKDFTLKTGVSGQEDILIQDNGVTKRIKSSELIDTVDLTGYATKDDLNTKADKSAIPTVDVDKSYVDTQLATKANKSEIPSLDGYATEPYVTNKIAEASLSGGEVDLSGLATKDELATKADKTAIPTKTSQLTNDSGFLTEHQNISSKADKTYVDNQLATKSNTDHTHSYNDLTDKPTIPSTTNLATKTELTNGLATKSDKVHTHDQYLTEHQDLSDYALKTEIPSVPTKLSQLTNDKGYLTSVPSEYVTETELNNAISGLGGGTGNVSSDVINSIVVVDELPTVEVPGVLYLIKGSGTATEPDTPETPEATNLYYQSEEKTYTSTSSGYNFTWSTDCNILFNSTSELAKEREQSSGDFTLDLVGGKTYKLKATYVSGEMSSSTGEPNYHIYLKDSVTSTKYCEISLSNGQNAEGTFTASTSETLTAAKMYVYVYIGTLYTNLVYNITLTEV